MAALAAGGCGGGSGGDGPSAATCAERWNGAGNGAKVEYARTVEASESYDDPEEFRPGSAAWVGTSLRRDGLCVVIFLQVGNYPAVFSDVRVEGVDRVAFVEGDDLDMSSKQAEDRLAEPNADLAGDGTLKLRE